MMKEVGDTRNNIARVRCFFGCCGNGCCQSCHCWYIPPIRKIAKELMFASIPVSIAVAVSQFIQSIITYITVKSRTHHHSLNAINLQLGQTFVYCLIMYTIGKYGTYLLQYHLMDRRGGGGGGGGVENRIINYLEKYQYLPIVFGLFAENAGFAWKQFAVTLLLSFFYQEYGLGIATLAFFMWIVMVMGVIFVSYWMMHNLFELKHKMYYEVLSDYDSDAFGLSVAFSLTVLIACFMNDNFGASVIDPEGYLFEWESKTSTVENHPLVTVDDAIMRSADDAIDLYYNYYSYDYLIDDSREDDSVNAYYFIYCIVVTLLIALVFVFEEKFGFISTVPSHIESKDSSAKIKNDSSHSDDDFRRDVFMNPMAAVSMSVSQDNPKHAQNNSGFEIETEEPPVRQSLYVTKFQYIYVKNTYRDFWHTFLGCCSGIAWFSLIIDELMSYTAGNESATLIVCAICAVVITWRAPFFIHAITSQQEIAKNKFENYTEKSSGKHNPPPHDAHRCNHWYHHTWQALSTGYYTIAAYYYHLNIHHKSIFILSLRLTIGWIWEVFLVRVIQYVISDREYSKEMSILVNFEALVIVVIISILFQWLIRDIDKEFILTSSTSSSRMNNSNSNSIENMISINPTNNPMNNGADLTNSKVAVALSIDDEHDNPIKI